MDITSDYPEFFTATILEWKPLLKDEKFKEIILDSFSYLVNENRLKIYSFCIMSNHIHVIWQSLHGFTARKNQHSFLKFTAQKMKFELIKINPTLLEEFRVNATDRMFQFWERNPLSIILYSEKVFLQKLVYIHQNPVKAFLCEFEEDYFYSSGSFYQNGDNRFSFLEHY